jgi:hypothetical protein
MLASVAARDMRVLKTIKIAEMTKVMPTQHRPAITPGRGEGAVAED